ncbi:MAG: hypothetical protein PHP02_07345 [Eubacteriales bacterium]|nr:hypothetical protein [Eubacteriales bacterium]
MVHIVFVGEYRIPHLLPGHEAAEAAKYPEKFGILTSNLFAAEHESAMVSGQHGFRPDQKPAFTGGEKQRP